MPNSSISHGETEVGKIGPWEKLKLVLGKTEGAKLYV